MLSCEKWVGQVPEELLEQAGHAVYVVEEVLWVSEVEVVGAGVCREFVSLWKGVGKKCGHGAGIPVSKRFLSLFTCGTDPDSL